MADPLLRVRDLRTYFYTENGIGDQIYGGSGYNTLHANGAEICISDIQCIVYQ